MINSFITAEQTVATGNNILFNFDRVRTKSSQGCCGWLSHENGSGTFILTKPGIYQINFNCNVENVGDATTPIILDVTNSGENIQGAKMVANPPSGQEQNVCCSLLINNACGTSSIISIENNSGNDVIINDANIVITRWC